MPATWRLGLLGFVVAVAIALNIFALIRISELRSDVSRLESISSDVSRLQSALLAAEERIAELEEDDRWVRFQGWSLDEDRLPPGCEGDLPITGSWTLQEVGLDAEVWIEFRPQNASQWERYPAQPENGFEFSATAELNPSVEWRYRVVTESESGTRLSREHELWELGALVERRPLIEVGESVNDDGEVWFRYVVNNLGTTTSQCNEIVDAEIHIYDSGTLIERVEMQPTRPGGYMPDGAERETSLGSGSEGGATARDEAEPFSEDGQPNWWTDWIRVDSNNEVFAIVVYSDGTEFRVDEGGRY